MDKFLIFQTADNDCMAVKAKNLASVEAGNSTLEFTFNNGSAVGIDTITLTLVAGADELVAMKELTSFINQHPHSDGALVIADDVNNVYCLKNALAANALGTWG